MEYVDPYKDWGIGMSHEDQEALKQDNLFLREALESQREESAAVIQAALEEAYRVKEEALTQSPSQQDHETLQQENRRLREAMESQKDHDALKEEVLRLREALACQRGESSAVIQAALEEAYRVKEKRLTASASQQDVTVQTDCIPELKPKKSEDAVCQTDDTNTMEADLRLGCKITVLRCVVGGGVLGSLLYAATKLIGWC